MATVTGLTAARMLEIEAATITDAEFDSAGHLIVTRHDGTQFDAGVMLDASTVAKGIVELATTTETTTGTDTVRAVTPAGVAAVKALMLALTGGTMTGAIQSSRTAVTDVVMSALIGSDTFDRYRRYADGKQEFGPGNAARDTNLYRSAADLLKTDDSLEVGGNLTVDGNINSALNVNLGAWTTYTPTWTSTGTAPAIGNGTLTGKYVRVGRKIVFEIVLTPGSTTTFGSGNYSLSLPVLSATKSTYSVVSIQLVASGRWAGQSLVSGNTSAIDVFMPTSSTDNRLANMTATVPVTFASGNSLRASGTYEAAT